MVEQLFYTEKVVSSNLALSTSRGVAQLVEQSSSKNVAGSNPCLHDQNVLSSVIKMGLSWVVGVEVTRLPVQHESGVQFSYDPQCLGGEVETQLPAKQTRTGSIPVRGSEEITGWCNGSTWGS